MNGEALLYDIDNNLVYTGNFKDSKFDGFGILNEGGEYYIGEFKENLGDWDVYNTILEDYQNTLEHFYPPSGIF